LDLTSISTQLQYDYPHCKIFLDADNRLIQVDFHKMSLMLTPSGLKSINIFSRSGKTFYQALVQLIYTNFNILPQEGSYAESLIILKEDVDKYKLQKMAKEFGIGFFEDGEDIIAIEVDDGIEKNLLLDDGELSEEPGDWNMPFENQGLPDSAEWAELEDIKYEVEMAYLDKGIKFAAEMEALKKIDGTGQSENEEIEIEGSEDEFKNKKGKIKNPILGIVKKLRHKLK
jgi:hypothetical protein